MRDTDQRFWTLTAGRGLGLSCDRDGLFLGQTPLLQKSGAGFAPRCQTELERLLQRGFGIAVTLERIMPGLATVASALNANDL